MDCVTYPFCLISALDLQVDLIGNEVTIIFSQQHNMNKNKRLCTKYSSREQNACMFFYHFYLGFLTN